MPKKQKMEGNVNKDNFPVGYITGDRSVQERNEIMNNFRSGNLRILFVFGKRYLISLSINLKNSLRA